LLAFAGKARVHDLRVEADEAPAGGLEPPAVFAEDRTISLEIRFGRRLRRGRTDAVRIVTDVMIARQIAAFDRKRRVQGAGKCEIVAMGRGVACEVAAVDDEIGPRRVDVFADPVKIVGQALVAAGEMGIGNLGLGEIRASNGPSGPIIHFVYCWNDEILRHHNHSRHHPRRRMIQYSRDARNLAERPQRTGCPAFAGHDDRF
jgi:hypothetical protein